MCQLLTELLGRLLRSHEQHHEPHQQPFLLLTLINLSDGDFLLR